MDVTWTYRHTEPELWTVGFFLPNGAWEPASDHGHPDEAAARCHWLNGGHSDGPAPTTCRRA